MKKTFIAITFFIFTFLSAISFAADLEVVSWNWSNSEKFLRVEGLVKNTSGATLHHAQVVASIFDSNGTFVKSLNGMLLIDPLPAGENAPFKLMTPYNSSMRKVTLDFRLMSGKRLSADGRL